MHRDREPCSDDPIAKRELPTPLPGCIDRRSGSPNARSFSDALPYSDLREAISMEKRYRTSDLSSLS